MSNRTDQRIMMFISKAFTPAETRYSSTEREALSVLRCLEEVRWLVLGSRFQTKVYTDHEALISLLRKHNAYGRIARWQVRLAEYDVEFHHIPGSQNIIADGLSRIPSSQTTKDISKVETEEEWENGKEIEKTEEKKLLEGWEDWIQEEWYGPIVCYKLTGSLKGTVESDSSLLRSQNVRRVLRRSAGNFLLVESIPNSEYPRNRLLYRERNGDLATCVMPADVPTILYKLHDCHGHFAAGLLM